MPCYRPLTAHKNGDGRIVFNKDGSGAPNSFCLPCGQCIGCRYGRSQKWALRCMHEASMHDSNYFITLTYADMPVDGSLCLEDWQKFAKRLRYKVGPFRFYMCGEYGESGFRPHYHACMFGLCIDDLRTFGFSERGDPLYTSRTLEETWGHGMIGIGDVTFESAAYVARYCMKKANGELARARYGRVCADTGECYQVKSEFSTMSRNPGIGGTWFDRFMCDVFPSDEVVRDGRKYSAPRYYEDRLLSLSAMCSGGVSEAAELSWRLQRRGSAMEHEEDLTPERLAVREAVCEERLHFFERTI